MHNIIQNYLLNRTLWVLLITVIMISIPNISQGQIASEILCGDNIDNDQDGKIDLEDENCQSNTTSLAQTDSISNTTNEEMSVYTNPIEKMKISFPSDWHRVEINDTMQNNGLKLLAGFVLPTPDNSPVGVSIAIHNLSNAISLDDYSNVQMDFLRSNANVSISSKSNMTALDGYEAIYTNDEGLKTLQTWVLMHNKAYHITYAAPPERFDTFLPLVKEMQNSLVIG